MAEENHHGVCPTYHEWGQYKFSFVTPKTLPTSVFMLNGMARLKFNSWAAIGHHSPVLPLISIIEVPMMLELNPQRAEELSSIQQGSAKPINKMRDQLPSTSSKT
jgi:hypothetical protein